MKNILKNRYFFFFIFSGISGLLIFISTIFINLDMSIKSLFPFDDKLERTVALSELSPFADKVIIYIESENENELYKNIDEIGNIIKEYPIDFKNTIPDIEQIKKLLEYSETNSILIYPYEINKNPFTDDEIIKRLNIKSEYLMSMPFYNPSKSFFLDPLMMGPEVLQIINKSKKGKYTPVKEGLISDDRKAYLKVLKCGFFSEDYSKVKLLVDLNKKIEEKAKLKNYKAFLFSAHLFYWESLTTIKHDVTIIFILTIIFVFFIFYFFFRKIELLLFSFLPIIGGFALTFSLVAIIFKNFGGIALAFGATTSGIAIDYTIHYLTKRNLYPDLKEVRKKIGFSLILGFITTIASFIFLPFSRIKSLIEISVFGGCTISFAFLLSWFVLQKLIPPGKITEKTRIIKFPIPDFKSFLIWTGIILASGIFIFFIKFEDNVFNLDMNHKKLNENLNIIKTKFTESSDNIFLAFKGKTKDEILQKSLNAFQIIKRENPDLTFFTPALLIPPKKQIEIRKKFILDNFNKNLFKRNLKNSVFEANTFNEWINTINGLNNFQLTELPDFINQEIESMFVEWENDKYILIPLYEREISNKINKILSNTNIDYFIIDIMKDSSKGLLAFEKSALILLILSIIIIFIILFIAYKNILYAFTSILPCISALLACIGITFTTGRDYNIMHFVSSILLLGIGVDYGIFITGAFRDNFNTEELQLTYQSIFISALTTIAGFGVLALSKNHSIFSLGSSMFAGIVFAFLTSYLSLPFLLKNRNIKK